MRKHLLVIALLLFAVFANAQVTNNANCDYSSENFKLPDSEKFQKALKDSGSIESSERAFLKPLPVLQDKLRVISLKWNECSAYKSFQDREVWVFLPEELRGFYDSKSKTAEFQNKEDRLRKLLGLKFKSDDKDVYKCLIELEVSPNELVRPTFLFNIQENEQKQKDNELFFLNWWLKGEYPFTALGYTCDWYYGDGCRYGLTEFYIKPNNNSIIKKVCTIDDYFENKC